MAVTDDQGVFAHTPNEAGVWHTLRDHLAGTARRAARFAAPFGGEDFAYTAGWLHDVGKCSCVFADYLAACDSQGNSVARRLYQHRDHKRAGAVVASDCNRRFGPLMAALILGHHGGIPDRADVRAACDGARNDPTVSSTLARARKALGADTLSLTPRGPPWLEQGSGDDPSYVRDVEMFFRLVFSALVDADFLDTEAHFAATRPVERMGGTTLAGLEDRFVDRRASLLAEAHSTAVNRARSEMYDEVLSHASMAPGIYQLAAPTGAGKTMIGLGWALRHASMHGLRRVVTAVPFITVTDQVASVYRELLEANEEHPVLEHHSEVAGDDGWRKLAAENWDAPVIVTTTVQLFDSLFSHRTSATRKLHRLAGSVIILDEAQAIPIETLEPVADGLRSLVDRFGASVLIMTATQPSLEHLRSMSGRHAISLLPDPARWENAFARTSVVRIGELDHEAVGRLVAQRMQCLCVLNTIGDARRVTRSVPSDGVVHLSTMLRPIDRRARIDEIRDLLERGAPCRVVSTQLIEAGIDLDFPVVMRAMGPLPSLAQVDGRCNRNGLLDGLGETFFFDLVDGKMPLGAYYRVGTRQTEVVMARGGRDVRAPSTVAEWYALMLNDSAVAKDRKGPDRRTVQDARATFDYTTVGHTFRMIDDDTVAVVVPWPPGHPKSSDMEALLERLGEPWRRSPLAPSDLRALQDVTVMLRRWLLDRAVNDGLAVAVTPTLYNWTGGYDDQLGLVLTGLPQKEMII